MGGFGDATYTPMPGAKSRSPATKSSVNSNQARIIVVTGSFSAPVNPASSPGFLYNSKTFIPRTNFPRPSFLGLAAKSSDRHMFLKEFF